MNIDFIQFLGYGIGCAIVPRVTLGIVFLQFEGWGASLALLAFWTAADHRRSTIATAKLIANALHCAVTGRQFVVDRIIEKVVEKPVEKIVERVRTVTQYIKVNEMSREQAFSCLGCQSDATLEQLSIGYRSMMQKVHPDKGGSVYLATLVNQAKMMLLQ